MPFGFCFGGSEFPSPILRLLGAVRVLEEYDAYAFAACGVFVILTRHSQQRQQQCHANNMLHTIANLAVPWIMCTV